MEKERYYVSVSTGMINKEPALTDQLTIMAADTERGNLQTLLDREKTNDDKTHVRALIPYKSADHDKATNWYNDGLVEVCRYIYQIGTVETRRHIDIWKFWRSCARRTIITRAITAIKENGSLYGPALTAEDRQFFVILKPW